MENNVELDNLLKNIVENSNTARSEIENKSNEFINRLIIKIISTVLNKKIISICLH